MSRLPNAAMMDAFDLAPAEGEVELDVERGAGRYVDRPAYASYYDALKLKMEHDEPTAVKR